MVPARFASSHSYLDLHGFPLAGWQAGLNSQHPIRRVTDTITASALDHLTPNGGCATKRRSVDHSRGVIWNAVADGSERRLYSGHLAREGAALGSGRGSRCRRGAVPGVVGEGLRGALRRSRGRHAAGNAPARRRQDRRPVRRIRGEQPEPDAPPGEAQRRTVAHVDEEPAAGGWAGGEGADEGQAPEEARADADAGLMAHQDGSTHRWMEDAVWDLVVTLDDATTEGVLGVLRGRGGQPGRACAGFRRRSSAGDCSAACGRTAAATTGARRRPAGVDTSNPTRFGRPMPWQGRGRLPTAAGGCHRLRLANGGSFLQGGRVPAIKCARPMHLDAPKRLPQRRLRTPRQPASVRPSHRRTHHDLSHTRGGSEKATLSCCHNSARPFLGM